MNTEETALMKTLRLQLDRYQPHTNCHRAIMRTIEACQQNGLFDMQNHLSKLCSAVEKSAEINKIESIAVRLQRKQVASYLQTLEL